MKSTRISDNESKSTIYDRNNRKSTPGTYLEEKNALENTIKGGEYINHHY
jgi:hypothetical protein